MSLFNPASCFLCAEMLAATVGPHLARASDIATVATVATPAVITATDAQQALAADRAPYVVLDVTSFTPPKQGSVQAVVELDTGAGAGPVLGRFGVFPNAPFAPGDKGAPHRFIFRLPPGLAAGEVKLRVALAPIRGSGEGAALQLGGAHLETRG